MAGRLQKKVNAVGDFLLKIYDSIDAGDETWFLLPDGQVVRLLALFGDIGFEYADSLDLAKQGIWGEDGTLYDGDLPAEEIVRLLKEETEM